MKWFVLTCVVCISASMPSMVHAQSMDGMVPPVAGPSQYADTGPHGHGGLAFERDDYMYHEQSPTRSWSAYNIVPTITSSGGYGDASGSIPGDPVQLLGDANPVQLPDTFYNRPDLPLSDDQLAQVALHAANGHQATTSDAYDKYTH